MGDIFREVDEELKQERYEKLWRQYRWHIMGAAIVMVAAVAGWQTWNAYQTSQRHAEGQKFAAAAALLVEGKPTEAADAFSGLTRMPRPDTEFWRNSTRPPSRLRQGTPFRR